MGNVESKSLFSWIHSERRHTMVKSCTSVTLWLSDRYLLCGIHIWPFSVHPGGIESHAEGETPAILPFSFNTGYTHLTKDPYVRCQDFSPLGIPPPPQSFPPWSFPLGQFPLRTFPLVISPLGPSPPPPQSVHRGWGWTSECTESAFAGPPHTCSLTSPWLPPGEQGVVLHLLWQTAFN